MRFSNVFCFACFLDDSLSCAHIKLFWYNFYSLWRNILTINFTFVFGVLKLCTAFHAFILMYDLLAVIFQFSLWRIFILWCFVIKPLASYVYFHIFPLALAVLWCCISECLVLFSYFLCSYAHRHGSCVLSCYLVDSSLHFFCAQWHLFLLYAF